MLMTTATHARILQNALESCGGEIALAQALGVSGRVLSQWLAGDEAPPGGIYLVALALTASAARAGRGRVAT
jgi:DNA-binding transcriptional regulator YdaS (Cro superfamily)